MDDLNNPFGTGDSGDAQNNEAPAQTPEVNEAPETPSEAPAEENNYQDEIPAEPVEEEPPVQNSNGYPYQQNTQNTYSNNGNGNPYPYANSAYPYASGNNANQAPAGNGAPVPPSNGGKNSSNTKAFKIIGIVCAALLVLLAVLIAILATRGKTSTDTKASDTSQSESADVEDITIAENSDETTSDSGTSYTVNGELTPQEVFKKINPSSVGIIVYDSNGDEGDASGIIIQEDNTHKYTYVLTCAHVISDIESAVVQLADSTQYKAEIVGYDSRTDIGVLKIEASGLTLAEIGDSDALSVGDSVYAIGNPDGTTFANSFTDGMVSAISRSFKSSSTGYTMEYLQHTATINPGNSGGALVNSRGQVIGVNSSKIVSEEYEGMFFAVPSSVFVDVVNSIIADGYVTNRVKLGISYTTPANAGEKYAMYAAMKDLPSGSIVIAAINSDSSFTGTDVEVGDIITGVNGKDLDSTDTLLDLIENGKVGDELTITITRINWEDYTQSTFTVTVKLIEDKSGTSAEETTEETTASQSAEDFYSDFYKYFYGSGNGSSGSSGSSGNYSGNGYGY